MALEKKDNKNNNKKPTKKNKKYTAYDGTYGKFRPRRRWDLPQDYLAA